MNSSRWKQRGVWLAIVAGAYWALIFTLTHAPSTGGTARYGADKVAHFLAYLVLAVLVGVVASLWRGFSFATLAWVWLIVAGYGVFDELSQSLVPGRTCSIYDWIADVLGGLTGVLLLLAVSWMMNRHPPGATRPSQNKPEARQAPLT